MKKIKSDYLLIISTVAVVLFLVGVFMKQWPWLTTSYNSYIIQSKAWLNGRLDLGQNYSHLEIATYNGKFFLSFPPFPSYVMLPLVAIFGNAFYGGFLAAASLLAGCVYCYKIYSHFRKEDAVFFALFTTICSNLLLVSVNDWVWFIAQNMCFTLTVMSIYYAIKGKGILCFALWACAVGCRPFTFLYLPMLIMICQKNSGITKKEAFAKKLAVWAIIPIIIGLSYAILNYLRFGNPIEFGHNYLPEHLNSENGQFSLKYVLPNMYNFIRLPSWENGTLVFPQFNGVNMFIASPIFIVGAYMFARGIKKGDRITLVALVLLLIELFCLALHVQLGGWHYGNRYTIDVIPFAVYAIAAHNKGKSPMYIPLALLGFGLNFGWMWLMFVR